MNVSALKPSPGRGDAADGKSLYAVDIQTRESVAAVVELGLERFHADYASWHAADGSDVTFTLYMKSPVEAEAIRDELNTCLAEWVDGGCWSLCIRRIAEAEWGEAWKRHFSVIRVSDRLVIKPSWAAYEPAAGEHVITLDPGMSFGTGQHFTTRSCLQMIDRFAGPHCRTLLDAGCGSGILSIAAARLGFGRVTGIDLDSQAVSDARSNALRNGVEGQTVFLHADLLSAGLDASYDVVVANLFAETLIACAAPLARRVRPQSHSRLVMSGILAQHYGAVRDEFAKLGLDQNVVLSDGEWVTGVVSARGA